MSSTLIDRRRMMCLDGEFIESIASHGERQILFPYFDISNGFSIKGEFKLLSGGSVSDSWRCIVYGGGCSFHANYDYGYPPTIATILTAVDIPGDWVNYKIYKNTKYLVEASFINKYVEYKLAGKQYSFQSSREWLDNPLQIFSSTSLCEIYWFDISNGVQTMYLRPYKKGSKEGVIDTATGIFHPFTAT